ncbi:MAG: thymidine phosphorylase [Candidatus Levyibacteriota bacterium]|jgi:putative thymidine phosphorylase
MIDEKEQAVNAIRKKILGKNLTYKEIYAIMDQISRQRLGEILTTYFAASGYSEGFSNQELYYLTKAMVETGHKLQFKGIIADKHSIGGVPGTRTTPIVVAIVAAAGFKIPKSSSRAITTPDGTADDMEVLAPVELTEKQIYDVVNKTNGCIVWGGSFKIAPADDLIIQVEKPLVFESFDKILVSIMAKKIAFGSNHVVIDLPYGRTVKAHSLKDAQRIQAKFNFLAKKFKIRLKVLIHHTEEPAGRGIGPVLEIRESLKVLEQTKDRPLDLEVRAINLASNLLELCLEDSPQELRKSIKEIYGNTYGWALDILQSGRALEKFKQIVEAQGGNPNVKSDKLRLGKNAFEEKADKSGVVKELNCKNITAIAKILGAPKQKGAGIYLNKKIGDKVLKNETIYTLFSENVYNLKEGKDSLVNFPIVKYT